MCKPGEPCNEAGKNKKPTNTQVFFGRLEMLIVLSELHEAHAVDMPKSAIDTLDVLGPMLMDSMCEAKGWDGLQMAKAIIQQKRKLFGMQGMTAPANPLESLVEMLAEIMGDAEAREKNDTMAKQAEKPAAPSKQAKPANDTDHGTIHMFVMRAGKDEPAA